MTNKLRGANLKVWTCADCGAALRFAYSFHPYWACVLVKAGVDLATYPELVEAMASRDRRSRADWGERSRFAKLTADQVLAIREALATGEMATEVAARFHVDPSTIGHIKRGKSWRSLIAPLLDKDKGTSI